MTPLDSHIVTRSRLTIPSDPPEEVEVTWREVRSSNVRRVGWDNADNLYVIYHDKPDTVFAYMGVTRQRAIAAAKAESTGSYINQVIKPHHEFVSFEIGGTDG